MGVDRRNFIHGAGAAFLAANGTILISLPAQAEQGQTTPPPRIDPERVNETAASPALTARFVALLRWLDRVGWREAIREACGLDLDPLAPALDALLFRPISAAAFGGFGGVRLVEPGDPAMSLLYHLLASPALTLPRAGRAAPASAYPSLAQIDLLEDYIQARLPPAAGDFDLVLAMFAYEYRPAHKTPHGKHSDLVFSRTGVARSGNASARYDPLLRSYVNEPADGGTARVAVTPARYALFLARPVRDPTSRIGRERRDGRRTFLMPVRKVYSGCPSIGRASLHFAESHRDEKLARLAAVEGLAPPPELALVRNRPPFLRHSRSTTTSAGATPLPGHDSALVELEQVGSSVLIIPRALEALIEPAEQDNKRLRFKVPRGRRSNRRYTSLKLEEHGVRQILDFALSDVLIGRGGTTGFRAPKYAPSFVNIRYKMDAANETVHHLGPNEEALLETTDLGNYHAGLFVDGLCDGCVTAHFEVGQGGAAPARSILPAFSIVAAPDFFPEVDPLDLSDFDDMFLEGGTEAASGGRRRANPNIPHPIGTGSAFPIRPAAGESQVADTITAVVSAAAGVAAPEAGRIRSSGLNTLPDTTSYIFAPGWDMTYSRSSEGATFYATYGLGSPFPEDMKLCAVANGMWPGVSPDAARTFHPGLGGLPSRGGFSRRPQTAVPLLDEELGYHRASPAVAEDRRAESFGWDGEQGPYFEVAAQGGRLRLKVNYPDVGRVDYVQNVLDGKLDFSRLRGLDGETLIRRMRALRLCVRALPEREKRTRFTDHWLVSAEEVLDWNAGAAAFGVPRRLFGDVDWARRLPPGTPAICSGWLYIFARIVRYQGDAPHARASVDCRDMSVCQVVGERVRWCRVSGSAPRLPTSGDWHWSDPAG